MTIAWKIGCEKGSTENRKPTDMALVQSTISMHFPSHEQVMLTNDTSLTTV